MTFKDRIRHVLRTGDEVVRTYFHFKVSRSAAGLSYYLLLSLFPLILCVSILISQFRLTESDVLLFLESWITDDISTFSWQHSDSIGSAVVAFIISMTLLITYSGGAFRCLSFTAEEITGEKRFSGIFGTIFSYLFSLILFLMVYASIFVMILWDDLITLIRTYVPLPVLDYLTGPLRYIVLFAVIFFICFVLNFLMQPKDVQKRGLIPGSLFTAIGLSVITVYFSMFIRGSAKYSYVYGSLVSIVLLMMWLYMCGSILMIGVIINSLIHKQRR